MSWTLLAHVHTRHSFDCRVDPVALVRRATTLGVDVVAVTDHNSWRGSVEAQEAVALAGLPLRVILATEAATDQGDVIGLFLRAEPHERVATRFCDAVHAQAGLVLLPHPYRYHRLDEALLQRVDLVEVYNARTPRADNERAAELARARGLPALVGPDAHRLGELPLARVEFDGDLPATDDALKQALLHTPRRFHTAPGSVWNEWLSQAVKWTKRPSGRLAWGLARGAMRRLLKPGEHATR
jgi:predicted metal-dependent phosphoesterase TrpH